MNTATWPLVGRAGELSRVVEAIDGHAGGVLLAGPAGVGKTRLAFECVSLATDRGYATAHVRANRSSATIPYGAFAGLLPPAAGRAPESRGDLLRHFAEAVLDRVDVSPLTVKDIAMLAADVLGGPVEGSTVHSLWTTSEGNVLFLRELIIAAVDSGALTDARGIWLLQGSLAASPGLTELVRLRLGTLDDEERHALEVVSVGEPITLTSLEVLTGRTSIERLESRALVDVAMEGSTRQVRMGHPLYGEVLRAELPGSRYERICREVSEAVERAGELSAEDALWVAVGRLESGDTEHAELLTAAAQQAAFAFDFRLARRLARAAWDAAAGVDAGHLLGGMLDTLGEHEEAEHVLSAVEAEARSDEERARIAEARVGNLFRGLGLATEAEEVTRAAESALEDPSLRAELVA